VESSPKRELLVSSAWIQAVAVVVLFGFFVLGLLAYRTYSGEAPIPARVVDPGGGVLFTHDDVVGGQQVFLRNGLMEYGSIFGHGAYLGPDFTADYLRRSATIVFDAYGGQKSDSANSRTVEEFKANRYDPATDTLAFSGAQSAAYRQLTDYYRAFFDEPSSRYGLRPRAIDDRRDTDQIDGVLRLVGLDGFGIPARRELFLYEQLASGAAGRKPGYGKRGGVECAVSGGSARRHRSSVRRFWEMELLGMAWQRA